MKDEHNIDQLFRAGLGDPEIPFNEMDWEKMSEKLDAYEKKRILPIWWFAGAGIAATLLVFLFTILLEEEPVNKKMLKAKVQNPGKEAVAVPVPAPAELVVKDWNSTRSDHRSKPGLSHKIQAELPSGNLMPASSLTAKVSYSGLRPILGDTVKFIPMKVHEEGIVVKAPRYAVVKRSGLSFSIMAAPDISGTGANVSQKISSNIGLMVTYPLSNKISLSTGLIYAKKLYNSAGVAAADNGYGNQAWEVNADCRVLDIPVNVNYQVFKKRKLAVSLNTGLSSYLMLNERYELRSGPDRSLSRVEVSNKNQHILGIANLSVSVERKLNSSMSIGLQPFVKLPLTGIGNYDVKLNSTGVSVFLNFGKPGIK